jgi:hypothetical protein
MLKLYSHFVHPSNNAIHEGKHLYFPLAERHLQIVWLEQKLLKNLMTSQGEAIEVLSPGIWNKEAGPDFLRAHLRIGQREYRGDIEIDLHEGGWYQHGHHRDARYNHVILHLTYYPQATSLSIHKENGQHAYACDLSKSLTVAPEQLLDLVDFDLYPNQVFPNSGRCAQHLFQLMPETQTKKFFQSAAYWRLEKKLNYLQLACSTRSLQFASGIAMALGYQHNAKAFLELFQSLMCYRDLPYQELLAIALGCCGFLEEGRKKEWEGSSYYQDLRLLWWGRKAQVTYQAHLKIDHIRPLHHPVRRLAYLAHFLQDPHLDELWLSTLQEWETAMEMPQLSLSKLREKLFEVLPIYSDDYWDSHYTFEAYSQKKVLPSLGKEVKMHILLNTTLPLLYATIKEEGNPSRWEKFQQFYASLEISQISKSRYLHHRFFGEDQRSESFFRQAQMAQGAYQLHQDFCTHYEASCQGCPFVERYQEMQKKS